MKTQHNEGEGREQRQAIKVLGEKEKKIEGKKEENEEEKREKLADKRRSK